MAAPRPKILTAFTVPTGGWNLHMYVHNGGDYNLLVECTIAAGDYFVSGDNQDDDFLQELMAKAYAALDACASAAYNGANSTGKPLLWINDNHKACLYCNEDLKVAWTEADGDDIAKVLGFEYAADLLAEDDDVKTATNQHAYGWYAEDDGQTEACNVEDVAEAVGVQSLAPGGQMRTIHFAKRHTNHLALRGLTQDLTLSAEADYTDAAVWPHEPNVPLECWWRQACAGVRFRVYQQAQQWTTVAEERGTATGGATTTLIDAGKAWDTNPQQFAGKVVRVAAFDSIAVVPMSWYITSHNATTLTLPNSVCNEAIGINNGAYAIYDQRYGTYVLDLQKGQSFAPSENPDNGLFSIDIPLRRYMT